MLDRLANKAAHSGDEGFFTIHGECVPIGTRTVRHTRYRSNIWLINLSGMCIYTTWDTGRLLRSHMSAETSIRAYVFHVCSSCMIRIGALTIFVTEECLQYPGTKDLVIVHINGRSSDENNNKLGMAFK